MADAKGTVSMHVNIAGVDFHNPVIAASGCFGYGREYGQFYPLSALGGIATKGTTLEERQGNPPPRIAETPAGVLNAVGLQNPGVDYLLEVELPHLAQAGTAVIVNIAGSRIEDYCEMARRLEGSAAHMLEVNISCPNVKEGGVAFGTDCATAGKLVAAVRQCTTKPLMVKLSPNVTDIVEIAKAAEAAGADALSLINTILAMRIDINTRRPILYNNYGGLSGAAVFPIALRMVCQVAHAVAVPVVGMGGITRAQDAIEMMMAGARAVQVGSALFADPFAPVRIAEGMEQWLQTKGIADINDIVGTVKLN